jgi:hypothetical protein
MFEGRSLCLLRDVFIRKSRHGHNLRDLKLTTFQPDVLSIHRDRRVTSNWTNMYSLSTTLLVVKNTLQTANAHATRCFST